MKVDEDKKIQPTLRSSIDLRSGLKGPQRLSRTPGNQEQGGRDLASGNSVVFGEQRVEKGSRWPDTKVLEGGNNVGRRKGDKGSEDTITKPRG